MTVPPATLETRPVSHSVVPGAAVVAVTFGLARYGYGLLLPDMTAALSLSPGAAGLISSGAYLSYLVANVGVVTITNRAGPRVAIGLASAVAAAGMSMVAAAHSALTLAVGVLVAGAAAGLALPPYAEVVQRRVTRSRRDVAWSAISSGTGWGVAVAGPIAIAAGDQWRVAWLIFVGLAVVTGVFATLGAPGRDTDSQHRRPQLSWTWFVCPRSRPLLISAVLVGAGSSVWWAFSVGALRADGLGETRARIVYAMCGVAGIAASAAGTVFARVGLRAGYLVTVVLLGASVASLTLAASGLGSALVAAAAFGVLYPTVIAAQGIWSSRVFADHPAAGVAAVNTALTVGTLAGPAMAGQLVSTLGYSAALGAAAAVTVLAVPFCPPTARRRAQLAAHRCRATPVRDAGRRAPDLTKPGPRASTR